MNCSAMSETSCEYLLQQLQMIWDEVGEDQIQREKILVQLQQECLQIYRNKVDSANIYRAQLHQQLAHSRVELTHLLLVLGERLIPRRQERGENLKEQMNSISPALKELQLRKEERVKQFRFVQGQIHRILSEIEGKTEYGSASSSLAVVVNEDDLSMNKLEEYKTELLRLENEKNDRLERVEKYITSIKSISAILGMDSSLIITKVHPSLNELSGLPKNITHVILEKLDTTVKSLELEKEARLHKLQTLGIALNDIWNLMSTSDEDRKRFLHLTSSSKNIYTQKGSLTLEIVRQVEMEVKRLDQFKTTKMKELFFRKQMELEEICRKSRMKVEYRPEMEKIIRQIDSGEIDHAVILETMNQLIYLAEEEANSRKVIVERVDKWTLACDEELWLEEYNRDEYRYSISRCSHKNLRRAERARALVNKIPDLADQLISKARNWEDERKKIFLLDEVPLLSMLEEYTVLRKEKEEEKQRQRKQKKVTTYQGSPFGTRPGTSSKRLSSSASPMNMKLSSTQSMHLVRGQKMRTQRGFGDHLRDDTISVFSSISGPLSP